MTQNLRDDLTVLNAMLKASLIFIGIFFLVSATFFFVLAYLSHTGWRGGHGVARGLAMGTWTLLAGIGFIMPQFWAKLSASLLSAGAGVWLIYIDMFWRMHLWIDCFFFAPLLLTFWLRMRKSIL